MVRRTEKDLTVTDMVKLFTVEARNQELLRRANRLSYFREISQSST